MKKAGKNASAGMPKGMKVTPSVDGRSGKVTVDAATRNSFRPLGGSTSEKFNLTILRETLACICVTSYEGEQDANNRVTAAAAKALEAFKPTDEIEGMLAAQATAMHFGSMECFRRAMRSGQPADLAARLRQNGVSLAAGMTATLDALDRKRGKRPPQTVRVERVVVIQEGGQAVVGNVHTGGAIAAPSAPTQQSPAARAAIAQESPDPVLDLTLSVMPPLPVGTRGRGGE